MIPTNLWDRVGQRLADPARMRVYPVMLAVVPLVLWITNVVRGSGLLDGGGRVIGADFVAFYMAGAFARGGRLGDLGNVVAQSDFQHALVAPQATSGFVVWINPPFLAYAFAPLAGRSYLVALVLFSTLGVALFVGTVVLARRFLRLEVGTLRLLLLGVSYFPTIAWLTFGQASVFSLALTAASVSLLLLERDLLAGVVLGLLAYKPQLAVGLALALLFARRWRAVLGGLVSGGGAFVLSYLVAPAATRDWLVGSPALFAFIRQSGYPKWGLASLYGASALLLDGVSRSVAGLVGAALTAAAVVLLHRLWRLVPWRPERVSFRLALAATLAAALLVSPHLYFYDLMLLLLPAALVFATLGGAGGPGPAIVAATAWVYFLGLPSPYLAMAEEQVTRSLFGHACGLQLETVAVGVWAWHVGQRAVTEVAAEG